MRTPSLFTSPRLAASPSIAASKRKRATAFVSNLDPISTSGAQDGDDEDHDQPFDPTIKPSPKPHKQRRRSNSLSPETRASPNRKSVSFAPAPSSVSPKRSSRQASVSPRKHLLESPHAQNQNADY